MLDQINYDFIITDSSKKMQSAHVHVLDTDADSDKIWFYYIQIQKYVIGTTTYIVPNTSVGKSKKQNNLGIFLVILLEELKVHR